MQTVIHYFLHFIAPFVIAFLFFRSDWKKVYLILLATMIIDIDHLLASPVFQADRCSIGFHPLHSYYIMPIYVALLFFKTPIKIFGIGLILHLFTDSLDCLLTLNNCQGCIFSDNFLRL